MKAKIKATGEIVEVHHTTAENFDYVDFGSSQPRVWKAEELITPEDIHWQNIRERAAIAALGGLLSDSEQHGTSVDFALWAVEYADALVEELKKRNNHEKNKEC